MLLLLAAFIFQFQIILAYTPLFSPQAKSSSVNNPDVTFTLLLANVKMDNLEYHQLIQLVKEVDPDVILLTEPDKNWADALKELDGSYPNTIKELLDNTYGMMLLSKLPLSDSEINYLVEDGIPSIFTKIHLPSGDQFDFYGVHPEPPKPGTDTYERDSELLIIGKKIKEVPKPVIVAGDLNDVGWSETSKLFRKYSQLLDPREGRGLYNTYNAFIPLFRYPLDHIFYSNDFGMHSLRKLKKIGSDHYPMLITLTYEPDKADPEQVENTDSEENTKVEEKIDAGKQE
jgi:endonuclease/exonuclease/phosphatase (EEP) superfamily protein YafD